MHCFYNKSEKTFDSHAQWGIATCHKQFVGVCLMERERERDTERERQGQLHPLPRAPAVSSSHSQHLPGCDGPSEVQSERHDSVLKVFGEFIEASLPPHSSVTIDLPTWKYSFPHHITPTNLRPNTVWWCEHQRELWLFELMISSESLMAKARELKKAK